MLVITSCASSAEVESEPAGAPEVPTTIPTSTNQPTEPETIDLAEMEQFVLSPADLEIAGISQGWALDSVLDMPAENSSATVICGNSYENAHPAHTSATFVTSDGRYEATQLVIPITESADAWLDSLEALAGCDQLEVEYESTDLEIVPIVIGRAQRSVVVTGGNNLGTAEVFPTSIAAAIFDEAFIVLSVATSEAGPPNALGLVKAIEHAAETS